MNVKTIASYVGAGVIAFAVGFGSAEVSKAMHAPGSDAGTVNMAEAPVPETDESDEAEAPVPSYVNAGRIVVPIIRQGKTTAYVVAAIRLEALNAASARKIEARLPSVRDRLLQSLYGMAGAGRFEVDDIPLAEIAEQLAQDVNDTVGGVRAVLFDEMVTSSPA